ncbi:hypothetical protein [Flavobacterium terrae]|uniref:Uncharacterized protein n=1 Tax=Flavobacterium terrae TaxID=415425 RepID=A0A1M6DRX8_9FLAO|nr:hypothetical protein [Flavobacterium terrae]SHI75869.1 hypothetical protein SAMN05444363_1598 [Flavobacterium terrae]
MLFTAIALVAFAGTSMANTIEIPKIEVNIENTTKEVERQRHDDCIQVAADFLDYFADPFYELTQEQSQMVYQAVYNNCMLN